MFNLFWFQNPHLLWYTGVRITLNQQIETTDTTAYSLQYIILSINCS